MAGEPTMTITGNLAGDPELRFTAAGQAVVNYTVAQTPRTFDRNSQQWQDDETLWIRCTSWGEYAENVAQSLTKGMRVVATGRLKARSFEDKNTGQQRTSWEMDVDEVGPSLRWATAQVQKVQRNGNGAAPAGGYGQPASQSQGGGFGQQPGQSQAGGFSQQQGQPAQAPLGGNAWDGGGGSWDQGNDSPPPF